MQAKYHIILFDGECNFCNFWVNYIIKRDHKDFFRFTSLQSQIGKEYLQKFNIRESVDTLVLIEKEEARIKSTAVLHVLKKMGGLNSIFYGFIIIPVFIRDFFYDVVARYRYSWFGKTDCEFVPNQHIKNKFLM